MSIEPQDKQMADLANVVEKTLENARADIAALVTKHGENGAHPLGLALALATASGTIISSMAAFTGLPKRAVTAMTESMFSEAGAVCLEAYDAMASLKNAGVSAADAARILKENAQRHRATAA